MSRARTMIGLILAGGLVYTESAMAQTSLGTGFTYQGRLQLSGNPVSATADFQFTLWNQAGSGSPPSGGSQIGAASAANNVTVTDGLFTAGVDFGAAAFNGDARWLQIAVRSPSGSGTFQTLSPRQPLTATPYASQTRGIFVSADEKVGIGTTAPLHPLHVFDPLGVVAVDSTFNSWFYAMKGGALKGAVGYRDANGGATGGLTLFEGGVGDVMVIRDGKVGIGTSSPNGRLTMAGLADGVDTASSGLVFRGIDNPGADFSRAAIWALGSAGFNGALVFGTDGDSTNNHNVVERMRIAPSGNVGIGTTNPAAKLEVRGGATPTSLHVLPGRNQATDAPNFVTLDIPGSVGQLVVWDDFAVTGNVGIGTTSPQAALQVSRQPTTAQGTLALEGSTHTFMSFYPDGPATRKAWFGFGDAMDNDITLRNEIAGADIVLSTSGGGATRVNVLEITGGSDVAEPYTIAAAGDVAPQPGMVVSIDPAQLGRLRVADRPYDRTVAGIVSGANGIKPGMVLRQEGSVADGALPVATVGRVWCWVDAGAGTVAPGDLLTTSDTPGHAMKVTDAARSQGAVIGKAMSSLERGRGLVLVLVALQ